MNRLTGCAVTTALLLMALPAVLGAAESDEEAGLVGVLQSNASGAEKDAACVRLKQIGTAGAVPALASLLTDTTLSHSARYALESMPFAQAAEALCGALAKTTGETRAGIIDSLGVRAERKAVPALATCLADADAMVASSAAAALGRIGGAGAIQALRAAPPAAPADVRNAVADGLLLCADRLLAGGDTAGASALYRQMYDPKRPEHVRTAAYRGLVLAAGDRAPALVAAAIAGDEKAGRLAALGLVGDIQGRQATEAFAALLAKVNPATQVALIEGLTQRGDVAALPAVAAAAMRSDPTVRLAAIHALGTLGDGSTVPLLAEAAVSDGDAEQKAAREALGRLHGRNVTQAILAHLAKARPAVQLALARALGDRRDPSAVPGLLKMAGAPDESVRVASIRALGLLADERTVPRLLGLLAPAKAEPVREAIETALAAVCNRSTRPETLAAPVLATMKGASVADRCVLLRVLARTGGAEAMEALRAGLRDTDAAIRDAAVRSLAESAGPEAAGDLLTLARGAPSTAHRVLALRGYWRLVREASDRPAAERWAMCKAGMAASTRADEKKLGLAELARLPDPGALKLARELCRDEAVRAEAQAACVQIAAALMASHRQEAQAALKQVAADAANDGLRNAARNALDAMRPLAGYITGWMVAGPYRQPGKECSELFDIPFPPEQAGAANVTWKPAPRPAEAALAWQADLGGIVGGDHCIVYLKATVHAPAAGPVRLEIGTDDGLKLWVNGKLVHANNAVRGLTPGQDKAQAVLRRGRNDFLMKLTQHTLGCGACLRIRHPDGRVMEGLTFDAL